MRKIGILRYFFPPLYGIFSHILFTNSLAGRSCYTDSGLPVHTLYMLSVKHSRNIVNAEYFIKLEKIIYYECNIVKFLDAGKEK